MKNIRKPIYGKEEMGRLMRWFFGLPLIFVLYIVLSLIMPARADGRRMVLVLNIISYIVFIMVTIVVVKKFLKFPFNKPFSRKYLVIGFWPMFALCLGTSFLWKALQPEKFTYSLQQGWAIDFLLSFVLLILAAFLEELLCRAYIAYFVKDDLEKRPKQSLIYCLSSAIVFTILHFQNPEVHGSGAVYAMVFYFIMGFALMAVYLRTEGIEAALGIHIANNLVSAWFFTYGDAALRTNAIYTQTSEIGPLTLLQAVFCTVVSTVIVLAFSRRLPSSNRPDKL